jgi:diguanylate cyclase (GGDEF)-like protein
VGVLFVDIDHFKLINDSYGHAAGDDVIVALAGRLTGAVRPDDVVCRFAGDEFVVLCPGLNAPEDASRVAARILDVLEDPVTVQGRTLHVNVSIGIAVDRPGQVSADDLLRHADTALYEAKAKGRARSELFGDGLRGRAEAHIDLLGDLRAAFDGREIELHYQPIVSLDTGAVVGAEALLRWQRNGEPVPPPEFIRLAEESGLIIPLGAWVIEQACRDAALWPEEWWVSVNVSTRQLGDDLLAVITGALQRSGLPTERLCVEVTETANLEPVHVRSVLLKLHELGIRVAIDDFGTGHSSLSHLRELPVGAVKIDRAFVGGMTTRSSDEGIVAAVVALARGIGVRAIAEGVETEEQAAALRALGCEYAQGYLFARPGPASDLVGPLRPVVPGSV